MTRPRTLVRDLARHLGGTVRVCGWAQEVLERTPAAVVLRDHTGVVTVTPGATPDGPVAATLGTLTRESALEVVGTVEAGTGGPEVAAERVHVAGPAVNDPPDLAGAPLDRRLDWRFLDLRGPRNRLVFEVQTTLERAMRHHWERHGFLELHSPKLRHTPNRSGRELFAVDYFDRKAYLAQSPQFHKQMAMAAGFDRVFEVGPVYRANPLLTSRHDTEFTSIDVEVSWIDSHHDLMALEEHLLHHAVAEVAREHADDVARHFGVEITVPQVPFPKVTMAEALEIVAATGHVVQAAAGDLDPEGERLLGEHVAHEHGHDLVFVTEYPAAVRPFYHMRSGDRSELTRSFDLLWRGVEATTGAQREHRYHRLEDQARERGIELTAIQFYLDFFKYGCPPHGGFGIGLTRALMSLLGVADVREVTYLPRDRSRLLP